MNQKKLRGLIFILVLLFIVMGVVISNAPTIDAETNITPTLYATNWNYLPYIRGLIQGPTVTATNTPTTEPYPPPETNTPSPSATNTPRPTATNTPRPTATNTPRPTATNTVPAPDLSAPTIHAIDNSDQDGNFTVAWTAVAGAEYYKLKQNYNDTTWDTLYEGPALSKNRSNMAPGEYCYRVRAFNSSGNSEWSADKCTTVMGEPEPEFLCEFETLDYGPGSDRPDVEMLHDGRLIITGGYEEHGEPYNYAHIFDPHTRSFKDLYARGGDTLAAVLDDGNVLIDHYSMWGEEWDLTELYEPFWDRLTTLDSTLEGCLTAYRSFEDGIILALCGSDDGFFYDVYPEKKLSSFQYINWEYESHFSRKNFAIQVPLDPTSTLVTNGIIGDIVRLDGTITPVFNTTEDFYPPSWATQAVSADQGKIYFSGGLEADNFNRSYTVNEAYMINLNSHLTKKIANMLTDRAGHEMISLKNGNLLAIGGVQRSEPDQEGWNYLREGEIYVPAEDKWIKAGSLNIGRTDFSAIQLRNGEIFIYGGETDTGPGPYPIAPPEIGRCEQTK